MKLSGNRFVKPPEINKVNKQRQLQMPKKLRLGLHSKCWPKAVHQEPKEDLNRVGQRERE